jgi:hypothetical protein
MVCGRGGFLTRVPPTPLPVFWQRVRILLKRDSLVKIERQEIVQEFVMC